MTEREFRDLLKTEGFPEPVNVTWERGKHNAAHAHDFTAKGLVLEGKVTISSDTGVQTCGEGDTFFMAAGVEHVEQVGPEGAKLLVGRLQ